MSAPHHLGPYRLLERIGVGGMAEVYRAERHGASGFSREFAVKVLLPEHAHDAELQRLLIAEAKLGAKLSHRNLVTVLDLGVHEGRYFVVMELVSGRDLRALVDTAPLAEELALHVVEELCSALVYLHEGPLGLVHRDVSPGNVLVSRSGEVKLADYGIAKATMLAQQTRARIVRGKYAYLSPEQLAGTPLTARTDQWSLAVTLAELVLGRRPFDGASPVETLDRIRDAAPDVDGLPEDLHRIVSRCLQRDPDARFADMADLRAAIVTAGRARPPCTATDVAGWVAACEAG